MHLIDKKALITGLVIGLIGLVAVCYFTEEVTTNGVTRRRFKFSK